MNLPNEFADIKTAQEITRSLYPNAQSITMIGHNADNIVALVDTDYALRFPRSKDAYLRSLYERHVLKQLGSINTPIIPRVLDEHADPPYVITSFVPGQHISPAVIRTFSADEQLDFSKSVARFAYAMHTSLELDTELRFRREFGLDNLGSGEPWPSYLKKVVYDASFPTLVQEKVAKNCYEKWVTLCDVPPTVVVHDDLHTENMMFDNNRLTGVIDFGDTNIGTPEQDLRQLYRISEEIMLAAVHEYQKLSSHQLNVEAIKLWAIMKELADYSTHSAAGETTHRAFKRTSRNLNTWFPEGGWGKGYDLSTEGFQ